MRILLLVIIILFLPSVQAEKLKCSPTPEMVLGKHYSPISREKVNVSSGITIYGKVLSAVDCKPIKKVKVSHWQANKVGEYEDYLRAFMYSDNEGKFSFSTEWPQIKTPHIHFIFEAPGYQKLSTQWVGEEKMETILLIIVLKENITTK